MPEQYNVLVVAWLFMLLIGGWLLVNALIDLGARRVRQWISARWTLPRAWWGDKSPIGAARVARSRRGSSPTTPAA